MTPELQAFLDRDPEVIPLVRLFHFAFGDVEYHLNEGMTPVTFGGQLWKPSRGWITCDPLQLTGNPLDANPAWYTVWNVDNKEGRALAYEGLNNPQAWSGKRIRQLWAVRGFPQDLIVVHVGRIVEVRAVEASARASIRIRAETIAAERNYTPLGEYTPRDQARRYPGVVDRGFDFVATIPGKKIKGWLKG